MSAFNLLQVAGFVEIFFIPLECDITFTSNWLRILLPVELLFIGQYFHFTLTSMCHCIISVLCNESVPNTICTVFDDCYKVYGICDENICVLKSTRSSNKGTELLHTFVCTMCNRASYFIKNTPKQTNKQTKKKLAELPDVARVSKEVLQ